MNNTENYNAYEITDEIKGLNDTVFTIKRPGENMPKVYGSQFGMSPELEDNTAALTAAFAYCAEHPYTELVIEKGVYMFCNRASIKLDNLIGIKLNGNGSEFRVKYCNLFALNGCRVVELCNLIIDWDWERSRLADLVRIAHREDDGEITRIDYEFLEIDNVDPETMEWRNMYTYDPDTLTPGIPKHREIYFAPYWGKPSTFKKVEKIADNMLRVHHPSNKTIDLIEENQIYLLRHYVYDTNAINVFGQSENITFDNVTIYSFPGMGYLIFGLSSRIQIINSKITLRPDTKRRISTCSDGIHIGNAGPYFLVENCDFGFMGDDAFNNHTNTGIVVEKLSENTLKLRTGNKMRLVAGDTFSIRMPNFEPLKEKLTLKSVEKCENERENQIVTFKEKIPESIVEDCLLINDVADNGDYVIRNCNIHENRARGAIINCGNGLIENNRFYRNQMAGLQVGLEVMRNLWAEGNGVRHLTIRNNEFEHCNISNWRTVLHLFGTIYDHELSVPVLEDIRIENNRFIDTPGEAMQIQYAKNVVVKGNTISNPSDFSKFPNRGAIRLDRSWNVTIEDNKWIKSPFIDEYCKINILGGEEFEKELTARNNTEE